jgi:hypothetical protein
MRTVVQGPISTVSLTVEHWAALRSMMIQVQGYMQALFNLFYPDTSIIDGLQHLEQPTPLRNSDPNTIAVDMCILDLSRVRRRRSHATT